MQSKGLSRVFSNTIRPLKPTVVTRSHIYHVFSCTYRLSRFSHVQLFVTLWTRLPCPWESPGKNTGVGCHAILQGPLPTRGAACASSLSIGGAFFTTSAAWCHGKVVQLSFSFFKTLQTENSFSTEDLSNLSTYFFFPY